MCPKGTRRWWRLPRGPSSRNPIARRRQQLQEVVQALQVRWPQAAKVLLEAEEDVLAYMAFPHEHWTRIFSTNVLERLNREVKRRTDVVGVFPDVPSVVRLVGAVLLEIDDEWQIERRYFSLESMQRLKEPPTLPMGAANPLRLAEVALMCCSQAQEWKVGDRIGNYRRTVQQRTVMANESERRCQ